MSPALDVKLEAFEGPLDLLLHLIQKSEIDIYDIPVAVLTDQYLAVLADYPPDKKHNLENMSEFLLMAATLLEIKSRMLLPRPEASPGEEGTDPRTALVDKLLEYQRMQTMAEQLKLNAPEGERYIRETPLFEKKSVPAGPDTARVMLDGVGLEALWQVFADLVKRREQRIDPVRSRYGDMARERFTLEEKIIHIERRMKKRKPFTLYELLSECESRGEMVTTFLAMLELIRRGKLRARQNRVFSDIVCEAEGG